MFKVGQKIECIDAELTYLNLGGIYEIESFISDQIMLKGVKGLWMQSRFVAAEPPVKDEYIVVVDGVIECRMNNLQVALDLGSKYMYDAKVEVFKLVKTRVVEKTWK